MPTEKPDAQVVIYHALRRSEEIADLERRLDHEREMRAVDARWLVRNTTCTRTQIAGVLGISRVTLDKYLDDGGMTREYMALVRRQQKERGVELYDSRDLQIEFPAIELVSVPGDVAEEK